MHTLDNVSRGRGRRHSKFYFVGAAFVVAFAGTFLAPARLAYANSYVGSCDNGVQGNYQYFGGIDTTKSTTGAIYGAYGDVVLGQELNPCQTNFGKSGGTYAEGANVWGSSGVVQLAIGHMAGDLYGTQMWYTATDTTGGLSYPAGWWTWGHIIGDTYRFYIWAVDKNPYTGNPGWELCINDYVAGIEQCYWIDRHESIKTIYWAEETHNTQDQMGEQCCSGLATLYVKNMYYMPVYQGNRSWIGPLTGLTFQNTGGLPSWYGWEWLNSYHQAWLGYTVAHP